MELIQFSNGIKSIEFLSNTENVFMTLELDLQRKKSIEYKLSHAELNQFMVTISKYCLDTNDSEFLWSQQISETEYLFGINFKMLDENWVESLEAFLFYLNNDFYFDNLRYSA